MSTRERLRRTFSSLENRNYRLYFAGQTVSITGTWMQRVSQAWLVLELTDSGTLLGVTAALQHLPFLLVGVWGGLLADRVDKRRLLLCTQACSGLLAFVLGLLVLTGRVELWMVLLLAVGLGTINSLDHPARNSFVLEMVGPEHVTNAVTLNSVTVNLGRAVGPAVAGALIAAFGLAAAFMVNAASFVAVLLALALMRARDLHRAMPSGKGKRQLRAGFEHVRGSPDLTGPMMLLTMVGLFAVEFQVKIPLLARYAFGGDAQTYGMMFSVMGVGAVLGGLGVASSLRPTRRVLLITAMLFGAVIVLTAYSPSLPLAYVAIFALGAANIAFKSTAMSMLQLHADPAMRGRVMSISGLALRGTTPLAAPVAGWLAEQAGARFALGFGGAITMITAVITYDYLRRSSRAATRPAGGAAADPITTAPQSSGQAAPPRSSDLLEP
ncbi:MFS transporter [Egicoccus sp. AB-alg6-2]|uniref:MFS transporter n=1 Tax=Egicoccus sp. AB-alg6-2 TaxID=3242692 RepID=UPI00359D89DB